MAKKEINTKKSTVSIVIPNLNQGHFLEEAIQSIIKHTDLGLFIAVMDAGSTDNSLAVINKYSTHITYWRSHPDDGQAAAINEGIAKLPVTDYVCWLNADDVFIENGLSKMVEFLNDNKDFPATYSKAYITDVNNKIISPYPTEHFSRQRLAFHCFICQPATLIRHSAWMEVRGVDPGYHMGMDYDLWWRLCKKGDLGYVEAFTACSRDHEGTKTRNNKEKHYKEAFSLLKKHIGYVPWHWCISKVSDKNPKSNSFFSKLVNRFLAACLYLIYRL
jgi:glycosyltransferase involved in cell wall biosynthesis